VAELARFSLLTFSAIFFIVDPFAVVPVFLAMTEHDDAAKRAGMARRACLVATGVLLFFALTGTLIFKIFGVTLAAFKIAGGILLLLTALDMLQHKPSTTRATPDEILEGARKDDIAIVPLAMPLLSGPGAIATVTMLTSESTALWQLAPIVAAILATTALSYLILRGATYVERVLGQSGQAILGRVMGLLLAAIAVEFMVAGLRESFPALTRGDG
jgi:multiple antibiotic resistance protein